MDNLQAASTSDWHVGVRLWMERAGKAVLGKGRADLLEGIDRTGSIRQAARAMGMSYRRAWLLVQSANDGAGFPLVEACVGGVQGGGATLTPPGRTALRLFRELEARVEAEANACLERLQPEQTLDAIVHVAAAVSLEGVLGHLLVDYALLHPKIRVRTIFGATDELANHLLAGAPADLFLAADRRQVDRLEAAGLIQGGAGTVLAGNTLAAVALAARRLPVRSAADLLRPQIKCVAMSQPTSPLGILTRNYLTTTGIYEALQPRTVEVDHPRAVLAAVRAGRADIGLVYGSDATSEFGLRTLFRAADTLAPVWYTAAVVQRGPSPDRARALLRFLTSEPAVRRFEDCGFLPATASG